MKKNLVLLMVVCLLVLGSGENSKAKEAMNGEERVSCGMTDLLGTQVKNPAGEVLGSISNFVFDWKGKPVLAVIYQGAHDDLDFARHVAVPFGALSFLETDPGEMTAILDIDGEKLAAAPRFDRTKEPTKTEWEDIYRYYGHQPYWTEEESAKTAPATVEWEEFYYP